MLVISGSRIVQPAITTATITAIRKTYFIGISLPTRDTLACTTESARRELKPITKFLRRVYSPEATGGTGCKLESREIVATIIPDRNCMVATSLLSNAWGVDDSTSKTPNVRRKWRRGETRIERTPILRQLAQSTRGFDSASLHSSTSPVRTHSAESPLSVCRRTAISGAGLAVRAPPTISLTLR